MMRRVALALVLGNALPAAAASGTMLPTLFAGDGVSNGEVIDIQPCFADEGPMPLRLPMREGDALGR